jgi:alpha-tubulin suppressor-like RCC1 family protein
VGGVIASCDKADTGGAGDVCDAGGDEPFVATSVAAGNSYACAVLDSGSVMCWGNNGSGQLGNGTQSDSDVPVAVSGITDAVAVDSTERAVCAVLRDGSVQCWGYHQFLPIPWRNSDDIHTVPFVASGISGAVAVSTGANGTCVILGGGSIRCWGFGILGTGSLEANYGPATVLGITNAVSVGAGAGHACALLSNGAVSCWGRNANGQVGTPALTQQETPVAVAGITDATALDLGGDHTCAVLTGGSIKCWGANYCKQLGNGTTEDSSSPVLVKGISDAIAVATETEFSCAILRDHTVKCWGDSLDGIRCNAPLAPPVAVPCITDAIAIAVGGGNAGGCVRLSSGSIQCWGANAYGTSSNGSDKQTLAPVTPCGF